MAYLTFDPSSPKLEDELREVHRMIENALIERLPSLGVAEDDVVFKMLKCSTTTASNPQHIEIVLKTDSNRVTAPAIVEILLPILDVPFEVTRIYVGYGFMEFLHEIVAFITRHRRSWASNY